MDNDTFSQKFEQLLQTAKEKIYEETKQDIIKALAQERSVQSGFEERLYLRWGKALDLFETILVFGRNVGAEFNQRVRPYAAKQNDLVFEVFARIHARSCMTSSAILSLLKSGYASDALARARTLHEMRVIATFIKKKGNVLAERYLLYEAVESLKAMKQYEQYQERLGLEPLEPGTIDKLEQTVQEYHAKFMPHLDKDVLKGDYGWAANALNNKRPTFDAIENEVGLAHWRPYFKMASYPVHASAKGIKFVIGDLGTRNLFYAGASNAGLADPASIALISFNAITTMLLVHLRYLNEKDLIVTYLKSVIAAQVMAELLDDAQQAFLEAHQQLVRDELELQAQEEN